MWKVVTEKEYLNRELIFPTQQKDVGVLVEAWKELPQVQKIVVFGSSVTAACNPWSDIDVFLSLSDDIMIRKPKLSVSVDLWTSFDVDKRLLEEIQKKGVIVFER